jgi:hypothetical protein
LQGMLNDEKIEAAKAIPKCHSCNSEDGWQHARSISAASPRTRAPAAVQSRISELVRSERGASHLNSRAGEHAQVPYPDAAHAPCHTSKTHDRRSGAAAPAVDSAGSNAESVILVPIATENLHIIENYIVVATHTAEMRTSPRKDVPALSQCTAGTWCPTRTACRRRPRCSGALRAARQSC